MKFLFYYWYFVVYLETAAKHTDQVNKVINWETVF